MSPARSDWSEVSKPPVSISLSGWPVHSVSTTLRSRVTPGVSWTTATRVPVRRLIRVDLPALGTPTTAKVGTWAIAAVYQSAGPRRPSFAVAPQSADPRGPPRARGLVKIAPDGSELTLTVEAGFGEHDLALAAAQIVA